MDVGYGCSGASDRRSSPWQTFVADNLEFRLGVAIGAAVAQRWIEENPDPFATPALDTWKETADLPWFAFWAKELLRWGTLDPFVAFTLSQGIARPRDDAVPLKLEFLDWMDRREDLIDPRNFLEWSRSRRLPPTERAVSRSLRAGLSGTHRCQGKIFRHPDPGRRWAALDRSSWL